jgi:hypothetical protein
MLMLGNFWVNAIMKNGKCFGIVANWSQPMAERRIESDKNVEELQFVAQTFSHALQVKSDLLAIYFVANVAMIGFLGWSTVMIFRIKREVDDNA